ncbi:ArsC/Spx/MgsR family protein [Enterococcus faecalis]|uniref:ArsC/Spx/MgsR family protein n=1 Tax=Enterococcus faecalis TaxID=1351 RepID=UPI0034CF9485
MTNILYTITSSKACTDAFNWLTENHIPFYERRICKSSPLKQREILEILRLSENGFDDLLKRSIKTIEINEKQVTIENLSTNELIKSIAKNPSILRTPILANNRKMIIGFQTSEMGVFVPKNVRRYEITKLLETS